MSLLFQALTRWSLGVARSISVRLGNGEDCLFWSDRWLDGRSIPSLAPSLVNLVPRSIKRTRTVVEGLCNDAWITNITGRLDMQVLTEYLGLWDRLQNICTVAGQQDTVCWRWEASSLYSSRSAYRSFFFGSSLRLHGCSLEGLGSFEVQNLSMARYSSSVLDGRSAAASRSSKLRRVCLLPSLAEDNRPSSCWLCGYCTDLGSIPFTVGAKPICPNRSGERG